MKTYIRRLLTAGYLFFLVCLPSLAASSETVRIGVLAFRPKPYTQAQWSPLAAMLKRAIPDRDFVVEALTFPELESAIAEQRLDFVLTNPGHYVLMANRNGLSAPLATVISNDGGHPLAAFGGVMFSRADRTDIGSSPDLRQQTVATVSAASLGGYLMQAYELAKASTPVAADAHLLVTGMPQDLVVNAVLDGKADVGFVRTGILESMVREGALDMGHLKILNRQNRPDFPYQLSTRLYPEWPFAVLKNTDERLARRVAAALFLIEEDSPDARAMGISGFATPADYTPVSDLLRDLRQPPFDAAPTFTPQDVWERYRWSILATLLAGASILLLGIRLFLSNRHLSMERLTVQERTHQLEESEARFRTVADFTFDWEYWQGSDREIVYMTPSCERITGYTPAEFVADPGLLLRLVHPEDRHLMDQHMHDIAYQDGSLIDFRIVRRDGEVRWITHHCRAVYGRDGQSRGRRVSNRDNTERRQAQEKLRQEMVFSETLLESLPGVFFRLDAEGRLVGWNNALLILLGNSGLARAQASAVNVIHADDKAGVAAKIREGFINGFADTEARLLLEDGSAPYFYFVARTLAIGDQSFLLGTGVDISARKAAETRLQLAASVFSHTREGIAITTADGMIVEVNDAFTRITGYSREEVLGRNPRLLKSGRQPPEHYVAMWHALIELGFWTGEVWNRRKNGEVYAEMLTISAVRDDMGKTRSYVALFSDITPIKEHQRRLEHIAQYDALTDLPNRVLLEDRLQRAVLQSQRHGRSVAVVYLDLDGFKSVNDQYGHDVGDDLLIAVAQRMKGVLREGDTLARIGGDEFVAILAELETPQDCDPVLARLLDAAAQPVTADQLTLQVSASIGVALYPQDDTNIDQLMRNADQAMYQAKLAGRNCYRRFDAAAKAGERSAKA